MAYLEFFDPRRLALQRELLLHPDLVERIGQHAGSNAKFEVILSEIATEFKIIVDGAYYPEELNKLCEILTKKLYERRSMILLQ